MGDKSVPFFHLNQFLNLKINILTSNAVQKAQNLVFSTFKDMHFIIITYFKYCHFDQDIDNSTLHTKHSILFGTMQNK